MSDQDQADNAETVLIQIPDGYPAVNVPARAEESPYAICGSCYLPLAAASPKFPP